MSLIQKGLEVNPWVFIKGQNLGILTLFFIIFPTEEMQANNRM